MGPCTPTLPLCAVVNVQCWCKLTQEAGTQQGCAQRPPHPGASSHTGYVLTVGLSLDSATNTLVMHTSNMHQECVQVLPPRLLCPQIHTEMCSPSLRRNPVLVPGPRHNRRITISAPYHFHHPLTYKNGSDQFSLIIFSEFLLAHGVYINGLPFGRSIHT